MMPADKYSMLLNSIQMFFLTSWVQKINGAATKQTKDEDEDEGDVLDDLRGLLEFTKTV